MNYIKLMAYVSPYFWSKIKLVVLFIFDKFIFNINCDLVLSFVI